MVVVVEISGEEEKTTMFGLNHETKIPSSSTQTFGNIETNFLMDSFFYIFVVLRYFKYIKMKFNFTMLFLFFGVLKMNGIN